MGRSFSARHTELGLPHRIGDWSDDHRLLALARRGEDCVGNAVLGHESIDRFLAASLEEVAPSDFPMLANEAALSQPGSSAGGEHPKFAVFSGGRHVLVKFADGDSAASLRWQDLLWCEMLALRTVQENGIAAVEASCLDIGTWRFLETDRIGRRGRRGVLSLMAVDNEYFGQLDSWSKAPCVWSGRAR